jgi:hypothetical protein
MLTCSSWVWTGLRDGVGRYSHAHACTHAHAPACTHRDTHRDATHAHIYADVHVHARTQVPSFESRWIPDMDERYRGLVPIFHTDSDKGSMVSHG